MRRYSCSFQRLELGRRGVPDRGASVEIREHVEGAGVGLHEAGEVSAGAGYGHDRGGERLVGGEPLGGGLAGGHHPFDGARATTRCR